MVAADYEPIADNFCMVLRPYGFDVRVVHSGEEILATAPDFKPEVLLSYIFTWGITGVEAAMRIRDTLPATRIMLFSGSAEAADALNEAAGRGYVFEVFPLPFHPDELLAALGVPNRPTKPETRWAKPVWSEPAPLLNEPPDLRNKLAEPDGFQRAGFAVLRFLGILR